MSGIEYRPGNPIADPRYEGAHVLPKKNGEWPYSPSVEWEPPIYHPFALNELIAVHLTDQDSRDSGILKPRSHNPFMFKSFRESDGWLMPRESLHFTLNGVVADHRGGQIQEHVYSWANSKFAYLIPLQDLYAQVISVFTHDTIALGQVALPQSTVIIENQHRDAVLDEVSKLGYQPLDIQGVKELDPAYLIGTTANVNHPINFANIIDNDLVDGPYTDTSDNNILVLDGLLTSVLQVLGPRNYAITISQKVIDEIQRRISFFVKRYGNDPTRRPGVARLHRIVDLYINAMKEDLAYQELKKQPCEDDSAEAYIARGETLRTREKSISNIISFDNASKALEEM